MKKLLALTAAAVIAFYATGCSKGNDNNTNSDMVDSASYRVGVGSYTTTADSSPSVEGENGKSVVSTTYATVIFDNNNIIRKVYIDEVQSKVYFDGKGQFVNQSSGEIQSKRELGDNYNMKKASGIGKEWYEQINSLESWLVGKNIEEINKSIMSIGSYGTQNNYAENIAEDVVDGTKDIVDGAKDIIEDGMSTAEGIIDNTTGSSNSDSGTITDGINSNSQSNTNNETSNGINWKEDLKSSVTIDLTNIQRAIQKAYANAK